MSLIKTLFNKNSEISCWQFCEGMECHGDDYQFVVCKTQNCPIDGNWGTWSSWHECSVTCGGGSQTSTRQCNDPPVLYGGQECPGEDEKTQNCNEQNCPSKNLNLQKALGVSS